MELFHGQKIITPDDCSEEQNRNYCRLLLEKHAPNDAYQFGHTYLFLHHYVPQLMSDCIQAMKSRYATRIQAWYRRNLYMLQFRKTKRVVIRVQSLLRMAKVKRDTKALLAEKRVQTRIKSALLLQTHVRKYLACKKFNTFRNSVIHIQSHFRSKQISTQYQKQRSAALVVQSKYRSFTAAQRFRQQVKAILLLQAQTRRYKAMKQFNRQKQSVTTIAAYTRRRIQQKQYKLSLAAMRRLQCGVKRWLELVRFKRLIINFHELCMNYHNIKTGSKELEDLLQVHPELLTVRNKWKDYCTPYQSAALGGNFTFFKDNSIFPLKLENILDLDIQGNSLIHYIAYCPNPSLDILRACIEVINAIDTKQKVDVMQIDDDDGTEEIELNEEFPSPSSSSQQQQSQTRNGLGGTSLPVLKSGFLMKMGTVLGFTTKTKRYLRLTDDTLEVCKGPKGQKVVSLIDIEGCRIDRAPGKEPIVTILKSTPPGGPPAVKKTMFRGTESVKPVLLSFHCENETTLQEWLKYLKMAAGVLPFRDNAPIKYYNMQMLSQWVQLVNKHQMTALHILAEKQLQDGDNEGRSSYPMSPTTATATSDGTINYDDDIILASWLLEVGCKVHHKDSKQRTAWQLSSSIAGDSALTKFLKSWSTANRVHPTLPPPKKSKGFSYVQIHFQRLYFYKRNTR